METDIVLLLTATVTPQVDFMKINKPNERRAEYQNAIRWYLRNTPYRIVVGENSGCTDLIEYLSGDERRRVELICYVEQRTGDDHGIYEMEIIRQCFEKSNFLKQCKVIFKITGRLVLLNIMPLANSLAHEDGNFLASNIERHLNYIDARFYAFNVELYPRIMESAEGIGSQYDGVESSIAAFVKRGLIARRLCFVFFPYPYMVHGRGGIQARNTMSHGAFTYGAA